MTHWTSIPFYLWKNTFKRWLENPFPALVKILIPALLAALGVIVLAMFAQIEHELEIQLKRTSALQVHVSEYVPREKAAAMLLTSEADELMWAARVGADNIHFTSQILMSARMGDLQDDRPISVYSKPSPRVLVDGGFDPQDLPVVELLSRRKVSNATEIIKLAGMEIRAITGITPAWLEDLSSARRVILIPEDMAYPLKQGGYIHHMIANLSSIEEVERFVTEVEAYTQADQRQVTVISAIHILRELRRIQGLQNMVRRILVAGCCLILSLTLGSIAWLEYRQDSYLLALLRSFGTPIGILFVHSMVENLLLVMLGILSVLVSWQALFEMAVRSFKAVGFDMAAAPSLPALDLLLIVLGGFAGVLLAILPIALGLRKPVGYTLQ